ncbi:hypothetical protein [Streptomyces sp. cg36]|uniref:hypothetical protein n=1 Tax=Streptomyces sp. cg36 TaxID=3238798 RepID=UPI0034E1C9D6
MSTTFPVAGYSTAALLADIRESAAAVWQDAAAVDFVLGEPGWSPDVIGINAAGGPARFSGLDFHAERELIALAADAFVEFRATYPDHPVLEVTPHAIRLHLGRAR